MTRRDLLRLGALSALAPKAAAALPERATCLVCAKGFAPMAPFPPVSDEPTVLIGWCAACAHRTDGASVAIRIPYLARRDNFVLAE